MSVYESLKADLDYLLLARAAEVFAPLATEAKEGGWSHVEYLAKVMAEQTAATVNRRLAGRLRYARFPGRRTLEDFDFDFDFQPTVDRKLVEDLATCRFVAEGRPLLFLGQPGCGKTHLAVALATKAVEAGYRGYFTTADEMVANLATARREGTFTTSYGPTPPPPSWSSTTWACCPWRRAGPPPSSTWSTPASSAATRAWSPPTGACRPGARSSAMQWWPSFGV